MPLYNGNLVLIYKNIFNIFFFFEDLKSGFFFRKLLIIVDPFFFLSIYPIAV